MDLNSSNCKTCRGVGKFLDLKERNYGIFIPKNMCEYCKGKGYLDWAEKILGPNFKKEIDSLRAEDENKTRTCN